MRHHPRPDQCRPPIWRCLACLVLLLAFLAPLLPAPPAAANAEPPFFFGSGVHPEDVFFKPHPTRIDLTRPGLRGPDDTERQARAATRLGLTMLRGGLPWDAIAPAGPDQTTWDWSLHDAYLATLAEHDRTPLLLVHYGVPWLADPLNPTATTAERDQFVAEFARFAGLLAARSKDHVRYYEIWNEPSLGGWFWGWGPTTFAQLLVEASAAITAADPDAHILFDVHAVDQFIRPGVAPASQGTFATQVLGTVVQRRDGQSIQAIDAIDSLAAHSYPDRTGGIPERVQGSELATYYQTMDDYLRQTYGPTRGVKGFLHTETGWATSGERAVSEAKQAALLARTILNLMSARRASDGAPLVRAFTQYDLQDDNPTGDYEGSLGLHRFAPDAAGELVPKPSAIAQGVLSMALAGATIAERRAAGEAHVYRFAAPATGRQVWAAWLPDPQAPLGGLSARSQAYTLQLGTARATLLRLDGTSAPVDAPGGAVALVLTEMPVLIVEDGGAPLPATATPTRTPTRDPLASTVTPTATATVGATTGRLAVVGIVDEGPTDPGKPATNLLDGVTWTRWETTWSYPGTVSVVLDLGSDRLVDRLGWQLGSVQNLPTLTIEVATAAEPLVWREVVANRPPGTVSNAWQEQVVGQVARRLRLTARNSQPPAGRLGGLSEIEVYGSGSAGPAASATPTAVATATSMALPTATAPPSSTATATAVVTLPPTAAPTGTATVTPAPTPTPIATATPSPTATATITPGVADPPTPVVGVVSMPVTVTADLAAPGYLPEYARDGKAWTRWETSWTTPASATLTLSLPSPRPIEAVRWQLADRRYAPALAIEVMAADGATWERVTTLPGATLVNGRQERAIGRTTGGVRLVFVNAGGQPPVGKLGGIIEVEVLGRP